MKKLLFLATVCASALAENPYDLTGETRPTDYSAYYLGQIFGRVGNVIQHESGYSLSYLFEFFNTVMISLAILVICYSVVLSVIDTAQEGKTLGKKWSALWVPFKAIVGVGLLIPGSSGYSAIQQMFMWAILQGVGAANVVWNVILDNVSKGVPLTADVNFRDKEQGKGIVADLFRMAVCKNAYQALGQEVDYYKITTKPTQIVRQDDGTTVVKEFLAKDAIGVGIAIDNGTNQEIINLCGTAPDAATREFLKTNPENTTYLKKHIDAVEKTLNYFDPIAKEIVTEEIDYVEINLFKYFPFKYYIYDDLAVKDGFFDQALYMYMSAISGNRLRQDGTVPGDNESLATDKFEDVLDGARAAGWLFAGSYYFTLTRPQTNSKSARVGSADYPAAIDRVSLKLDKLIEDNKTTPEKLGLTQAELTEIQGLWSNPTIDERVKGLLAQKASPSRSKSSLLTTNDADTPEGAQEALKALSKMFSWLPENIQDAMLDNERDPITNMAKLGVDIMITTDVMLSFFLLTVAGFSVVAAINAFSQPAFFVYQVVLNILKIILVFMFSMLYVSGFMLGVYMPLVPYIIYLFTAVGWFIFVIEALVAAPLVALTFASPSQDLFGRTMPAITILFNAVIYPVLMVIGFVLGSRLLQVIFEMLRVSLGPTLASQISGMGLMGPIVITFFIGMIAITLANKAFSLIYMLPDRVIRYVGGQAQSFGQESTQDAKQLEGKTQRAASSTAQQGTAFAKSAGKMAAKDEKK